MLAVATVGYLLSLWAWALLGPLAPVFRDALHLDPVQQALLVALPVLVGSLGRAPVGVLTDRFGAPLMFPVVALAAAAASLYLGLAGYRSFAGLLVGGTFLGIAGTAFAVGVPFVAAWFGAGRRGLAIGLFGTGVCGTAISGLTTVRLVERLGIAAPFVAAAVALGGFAVVAILVLRDPPSRRPPQERLRRRLVAAARLRITWLATLWYAIAFGGFVAFSVYLPAYLKNAYGIAAPGAADWMAAFVLVAVLMRPVGGWLSDRLAPARPLTAALAVLAAAAAVQATTPALNPTGAVALLALAAAAGVAAAATLARITLAVPPQMVGLVAGIVGGASGLAGFAIPLLMGLSYRRYGSYGPALALLAVAAAVAATLSLTAGRGYRRGRPTEVDNVRTA